MTDVGTCSVCGRRYAMFHLATSRELVLVNLGNGWEPTLARDVHLASLMVEIRATGHHEA
jgi:hypothetical protein